MTRRSGHLAPATAAYGATLPAPVAPPDTGGGTLVWSDSPGNFIGGGTIEVKGIVEGRTAPRGVAVDGTYIYWVNHANASIGRVFRSGVATSIEDPFIELPAGASPYGLTCDGLYLYWSDDIAQTIGRVRTDGAFMSPVYWDGGGVVTAIRQLAVDSNYIYFVDQQGLTRYTATGDPPNTHVGSIGRVTKVNPPTRPIGGDDFIYVGTLGINPVNSGFPVNPHAPSSATVLQYLHQPEGVAVDSSFVYWTNGSGAIAKCALNGDPHTLASVISPGIANDPRGIAVGLGYVWWINNGTGIIARTVDGSEAMQSWLTFDRPGAYSFALG